jgi:hypothetical protein
MEEIKIIAEKIGYNGKSGIYLPCNLSSAIAICILLICVFDKSNGKKVYVKIKLDLYKKKNYIYILGTGEGSKGSNQHSCLASPRIIIRKVSPVDHSGQRA